MSDDGAPVAEVAAGEPAPLAWWRRAGRWLAPSVGAAALAVLGGGLVEAAAEGASLESAVGVGIAAILCGPIALALALLSRWVIAAWRPTLGARGQAAPRVWAWLSYGVLATAALAAIVVNAVALLARGSAFKPRTVALVLPGLVVPAAVALVALSRPFVELFARGLERLGRKRRVAGKPPRLTGRAAVVTGLALALGGPLAGWYLLVRPRLGYIDTSIARYPLVGLALLVVGHALHRRPVVGRAVGRVALVLVAAAVALAVWAWVARPVVMLEVWAKPNMAGEAVDRLFDLERVRRRVSESGFPPAAVPGAAHPDVILVTIDTVRGDRTPLLGGPAAMPNLAGLGQRGVVFEWAFSPGNVTRRSLSTIITGASPSRLRGRLRGWALRMDPRHVTLGERFRAAGYDTAGFLCCGGFFDPQFKLGLSRGLDHIVIEHDGALLAAAARDWLAERRRAGATRPAFVWLHFIEPHNWRDESRELPVANDNQRYDHVLNKVDGMLGTALSPFDLVAGPTPIIAVTADHGEGLGDHGAPYHSTDLYNAQIRVPLVITGPGLTPGRRAEPVGLVDLAPTLLELAGYRPPGMPEMDGRSLAALLTGARPDEPEGGFAYAEMVQDRNVPESRRALIRGRWKLIESRRGTELYDLRTDPNERRNLAGDPAPPAELAPLRARLAERRLLDATPAFAFGRD